MNRKHHIIILSLGILAAGFGLAFLVKSGLRIYCPFHALTGLNCPGCGNTRAALALLQLDFQEMLHYNLLFPLEMLYIWHIYAVCAKNYISSGRFAYRMRPNWLDITVLCAVLLWTVIRNCTPLH